MWYIVLITVFFGAAIKEASIKCTYFVNLKQSHINKYVVVVTQPLPRAGGMAEHHGAPEAGKLCRVWTRELPKSEQRKESIAGQCRMR